MKNDIDLIGTYLAPLREDKLVTLKWMIFKGIGSIYIMSVPLLIKYITEAVEQGNMVLMKQYIWIFLIYSVVLFVFRIFIKDRWWVTLWARYRRILQEEYIGQYIHTDNNYAEKLWVGKAIAIINRWIDVWWQSLKNGVAEITEISIGAIFTFIVLYLAWWYYLLILLWVIALVWSFAYHLNIGIQKGRRKRKEVSILYTNHIVKLLMSRFEVLQSDKRSHEQKKIYNYMTLLIEATKEYSLWILYFFFGSSISLYITSIIIIWIIGMKVANNTLSFADFTGVATTLILITQMTRRLLSYYKDVARDRIHVEKMLAFFDAAPESNLFENTIPFVYEDGALEMKNISFWYDDHRVFDALSLSLEAWKKTAFVGPSGVGKSTLVKLLAGYLRADSGDIIIDKQKLSDISLKSYYKHIGYLTQDPSVFDGTILENLLYGVKSEDAKKPESLNIVEDSDLSEVLKAAKCEFIYDFKDGLETEIGERGIRLSWWQRQRLAIAKIMLKDPDIVLLDEPTSALDSFNEEQISMALHNLFGGRTVVIVAHRLQTVKQCDRILFFEEGKVVEEGTHDELIALRGKYKKMLDLQSGF